MCEVPIISSEECLKILEKCGTEKATLEDYRFLEFHNPFQGLIGEHLILKIDYKEDDQQKSQEFFAKTLSSNPFMFEICDTIKAYEKEEFFFQLLEEYSKYSIDTSFAPKGYFFKPYVTVLEDLSKQGFRGTPKRQLLDLPHCHLCLEAIAKFHASGLIYEKRRSDELGTRFFLLDDNSDILEDKLLVQADTVATRWLKASIEGLFVLIDLIPENEITHDEFKSMLNEILATDAPSQSLVSGVVHGDLWTSNFLYTYESKQPMACKLLDYQTVKYGPWEQDVMEFFMTNTSRSFRENNLERLLEFYYGKLRELLDEAEVEGEEIGSCEEFVRSCGNFRISAQLHAVIDHSYTFMADQIYGEVMASGETLRKFVFEEREKYIIKSYEENKEFRTRLEEDLLELRDLLFS